MIDSQQHERAVDSVEETLRTIATVHALTKILYQMHVDDDIGDEKQSEFIDYYRSNYFKGALIDAISFTAVRQSELVESLENYVREVQKPQTANDEFEAKLSEMLKECEKLGIRDKAVDLIWQIIQLNEAGLGGFFESHAKTVAEFRAMAD